MINVFFFKIHQHLWNYLMIKLHLFFVRIRVYSLKVIAFGID